MLNDCSGPQTERDSNQITSNVDYCSDAARTLTLLMCLPMQFSALDANFSHGCAAVIWRGWTKRRSQSLTI